MKTIRVTKPMLNALVDSLNALMGAPMAPTRRNLETGIIEHCKGCFYLYSAHGGTTLMQVHDEDGQIVAPLNCGFVSMNDLYLLINVYIAGVKAGKAINAKGKGE